MAFKIIWLPEAEKTFEAIIEYLEKYWIERGIKKFVIATHKTVFLLEQNLFLFKGSEKVTIYEVLVSKNNLLVDQISEKSKKVKLLSFWDTRQNPQSKFYKQL